jgi:mannose-6-phosphate isomerase class I
MLRNTSQRLPPLRHQPTPAGQYDLYPGFPIGNGKIEVGVPALVEHVRQRQPQAQRLMLDGFVGVFWEQLRAEVDAAFAQHGVRVAWYDVRAALRPEPQIEALVAPFLGGDDPIFGTRFTGQLADFFDPGKLAALTPDPEADLAIVYGCGAALAAWPGALLVYVDVPKDELQFRARAGSITNLGASRAAPAKDMYKRFYFVDWVALNAHKAQLVGAMDVLVDAQRPEALVFVRGDDLRQALTRMSVTYFRVRPWFEPGTWGGQWIKRHIPQLPQEVPNYAWSFELIVPENGLLLESDGLLLECSFDLLMYHAHHAVLGAAATRFGHDFPLRFDFLDTFDGGNLSVQCHPRPDYIRAHFGERFTQDETYYILDCEADAQVYLGFKAGIDPDAFRAALERSFIEGVRVDVEQFVQTFPAHKHDLFLIPSGTIHCSGRNNLVLEISATPYIFTFKMYDWLRLDLDGKPRPLNIQRAFDNLRFDRQGARVLDELIAVPSLHSAGQGWRLIHLPTHVEHFYEVRRYELDPRASVDVATHDSCQVMSLVEGTTILLETAQGVRQRFSFAETFVVPAAAQRFRLINDSGRGAKVVNAFMKESGYPAPDPS